jgi:16S rRNA (uracil1498-N3)-methyltransferase
MITLLVDPGRFQGDQTIVEDDAYRHLFRARRAAVGDRLRVVDGEGWARWGEVAGVERRRAVVTLGADAPANEPPYRLTLVVAALRPERASWLVEKATEIGVAAVRFLASERTPRQYGEAQVERWRRVASAAVEQCHRSRRPAVSGVHGWGELPELVADARERWFLDFQGGDLGAPHALAGVVLVGPEGGWSDAERAELERLGVASVALGPRVLRVETAAVVAAARLLLG